MRNKTPLKAFTILEIIIAIAVILILAAAALQGSGGIIRSMRFNNAFNKLVLMTQKARSMAVAGKNVDIEKYAIIISLEGFPPQYPKNTAALISYKYSAAKPEILDILNLTEASKLYLKTEKADGLLCNNIAVAIFKNGFAEPILACDGNSAGLNPASADMTNTLKISLVEEDAAGNEIREKTFSINHLSGLPQL